MIRLTHLCGFGVAIDVPDAEIVDLPQPNIILIMTDDQDYQSAQNPTYMPKLHALIREEGTEFVNAFAQLPLCTPSRACMLTGQSAHNHGVIANRLPNGGVEKFLSQEDNTVPLWLQEHGYTTGFIGKYLNGYGLAGRAQDSHRFPPGWDDWRGHIGQSYYGDGNGVTLCENGTPVDYDPTDYIVDVLAAHAVTFVGTATEPFYLQVCPVAPHSVAEYAPRHASLFTSETDFLDEPNFNPSDVSNLPWHFRQLDPLDAPKIAEFRAEYINRLRALAAVDDMIEDIVDQLTTRGVIGNTFIVFMGDNGVAMGAHRVRSKGALYDAVAKVPLVMRGPGVPAGHTRISLVDNVDVVATILDFAQVLPFDTEDLQRPLDGNSFRALFADPDALWKTEQFLEVFPSNDEEEEDGFIAVDKEYGFGVRTATRLYTEYFSKDYGRERELYDLTLDPWQMTNLINITTDQVASGYAADLSELQISLANWTAPVIEQGARQATVPRGLYDIFLQLGMASTVEGGTADMLFCWDAGSKLCTYLDPDPDIKRILDLKADQPVHTYNRAGTGDGPTPNGEAGRMSKDEYFSFDGGDYFGLIGTENTPETETIHKEGAKFTAVGMIWPGDLGARQGIYGTNGGDLNSIGAELTIEQTTGFLRFRATNGSGTACLDVSSTAGLVAGQWNFFAASIDEAANVSRFCVNGTHSASTATYTSPSAADATYLADAAAAGNAALKLRSGTRLAQLATLIRDMDEDELEALWRRTRVRFEI